MHENSSDATKTAGAPPSLARKFYDTLIALQYAPEKSLAMMQENVLSDLIEGVAAQNAFYRQRLAPVIDADGKANLAHWHRIPILTVADVVRHNDELRSTVVPKEHGRTFRYQTSGSTGSSLPYYRSELAELATTCGMLRHGTAMDLDWSKDIAMIRAFDPALLRFRRKQEAPRRKETWGPGWIDPDNLGTVHRLGIFTALEEQLDWLNGFAPLYLNTFPSNALALARHVGKHGLARPKLLAVLTAGEPVTPDMRREVEAGIGCPCYDLISNAEFGIIACECPAGRGYHLQTELARIELLDHRNQPVKAGQWGRVVVTPLYNFAMPLIRFDTGDVAKLKGTCTCGRHHPLIDSLYGRKSNLLRAGKAAWTRPDLASRDMEKYLPDCRWQLVQTTPKQMELRYMRLPANGAVNAAEARRYVKSKLGPKISVSLREVAALGPSASGKFPAFVNQS